jgi:nucleotide-binding universal stress UspA family protein
MKILLAVDDSKFSEAATQAVIQHMRREHAEVCVLHVVDLVLPIPTSYAEGFRQISLIQGKELAVRVEQLVDKAGFKVERVVEEGDPRSTIVDYAAKWAADLIVVGSHGRKGLDRFLMGSVAESVTRHARCSVMIVRIL